MSYQLFDLVIINAAGAVGIGTNVPAEMLHVEGNAYISSNVGIGTSPAHTLDVHGDVNIVTSNVTALTIDHSGAGDALSVLSGNAPALTIDSVGNIGVGTSAPRCALDLFGMTAIHNNTLYYQNDNANVIFKTTSRFINLNVTQNTTYWIGFALAWASPSLFPVNNFTIYGTMHANDSTGTGFASSKFSTLVNVVDAASKVASLDATSVNSGVFDICPSDEVINGTVSSCVTRVGVKMIDDDAANGAVFKLFLDIRIVADTTLGDFDITPYAA
jgi:hypothetical protein